MDRNVEDSFLYMGVWVWSVSVSICCRWTSSLPLPLEVLLLEGVVCLSSYAPCILSARGQYKKTQSMNRVWRLHIKDNKKEEDEKEDEKEEEHKLLYPQPPLLTPHSRESSCIQYELRRTTDHQQQHWNTYIETFQDDNQRLSDEIFRLQDEKRHLQKSVDSHQDGEKSAWSELLRALFFMYAIAFGMYLFLLAKPWEI